MKLRYKIGGVAAVILSAFLLGRCGGKKTPAVPVILGKDVKEQIIIDPVKHNLIVTTDHGTTVTHLPDRRSVLDVKKDGSVILSVSQLGLELRPFVGCGFADQWRAYMGLDFLYFKGYDMGMFGSLPMKNASSPRLGLRVSYTIWSHVQAFAGYDNRKDINAGLSVRF